jgi:hypothetical protein
MYIFKLRQMTQGNTMSHNKEMDEDDVMDEEFQEAPISCPEIEQEAESRALQVRNLLSR